jgi:ketosteroid isomerase-like protein
MTFTGPFEDRLAIHELVASYADAITVRDPAGWKALWAEDSEWRLPLIPGMESIKGRDAIFESWSAAMEDFPNMVALAYLGMLQIDGDTAIGRAYPRELIVNDDGSTRVDSGRYDDEYVKVNGQWLFKSRTHSILHTG